MSEVDKAQNESQRHEVGEYRCVPALEIEKYAGWLVINTVLMDEQIGWQRSANSNPSFHEEQTRIPVYGKRAYVIIYRTNEQAESELRTEVVQLRKELAEANRKNRDKQREAKCLKTKCEELERKIQAHNQRHQEQQQEQDNLKRELATNKGQRLSAEVRYRKLVDAIGADLIDGKLVLTSEKGQ